MAPVIIGATVVGAAFSAYSGYEANRARANQARKQAELDRAKAADALQRGSQGEFFVRTKGAKREGAQIAAYGASGVDVSSGSPADVIGATHMMTELDAATVKNNAWRESYGYSIQASAAEDAAHSYDTAATMSLLTFFPNAVSAFAAYGKGLPSSVAEVPNFNYGLAGDYSSPAGVSDRAAGEERLLA